MKNTARGKNRDINMKKLIEIKDIEKNIDN